MSCVVSFPISLGNRFRPTQDLLDRSCSPNLQVLLSRCCAQPPRRRCPPRRPACAAPPTSTSTWLRRPASPAPCCTPLYCPAWQWYGAGGMRLWQPRCTATMSYHALTKTAAPAVVAAVGRGPASTTSCRARRGHGGMGGGCRMECREVALTWSCLPRTMAAPTPQPAQSSSTYCQGRSRRHRCSSRRRSSSRRAAALPQPERC